MAYGTFDSGDQGDRMRSFFGPHQVDSQIRQAIQTCWISLPEDKRTIDEVERQVRRLVDRALRDLREASDAFGFGVEE